MSGIWLIHSQKSETSPLQNILVSAQLDASAFSIAEAEVKLKSLLPTVVVCDSDTLKNANGAFFSGLKEEHMTIPLITTSGDRSEEERLVLLESGADTVISDNELLDYLQTLCPTTTETTPLAASDFSMKVAKGELANVIQFLTMIQREGKLVLTYNDDSSASIIISAHGRPVDARTGSLTGMDALAVMLNAEEAQASFIDGVGTDSPSLNGSTDQILLTASVMADEILAGRA